MASRLSEIASKKKRLVVGLSSGTSADGVDAALVRIEGSGLELKAQMLLHDTYPYPDHIREAVLSVSDGKCTTEKICSLNYQLGEVFAQACLSLLESSDFGLDEVDVVGSHGQTVCHIPHSIAGRRDCPVSTLQLCEAEVIAEKTGAVVVCDFRSADIAAGGEGAPLTPCVDYILFRDARVSRGLLNIGGIANLTALPAGCLPEGVIGFDTGPGNMVLDFLARNLFATDCDRNGTLSARGTPSQELLEEFLQFDFFTLPPPKSAGREIFGSHFSEKLIRMAKEKGLSKEDLMATAVALTTTSIHRAYLKFATKPCEIEELYVSGGGVENRTMMQQIEDAFSPMEVRTTDKLGIDPRAKEALLFAVLANQAVAGEPSSLPQVTGAARRTVLGKIVQ